MSDNLKTADPLGSEKEITKCWLETVLTEKHGVKIHVSSWSTTTPKNREGFMSEICFVKVTYFLCGKTVDKALVFKFKPLGEDGLFFFNNGNHGEREVRYYNHTELEVFRTVFENSGLPHLTPEVFYSNMKNGLLTVVLSDLNSDGYRSLTPAEGISLTLVEATVKSIAVFHAAGIVAINRYGRDYFHIPSNFLFMDKFVKAGIRTIINMFIGTPVVNTLKSILPISDAMIGIPDAFPYMHTVIHGDLWAGNVMFSEDNKYASIFDWQFARIGNPSIDIVVLLLYSAHPSVYENSLEYVLETYWEAVNNCLEKTESPRNFEFSKFIENVKEMWIYGFMFFCAAIIDLIDTRKVDKARIWSVLSFLEKRNVFTEFLKRH